MAPFQKKTSFLVQFGGGAVVILIIANIIVRLLGFGSAGNGPTPVASGPSGASVTTEGFAGAAPGASLSGTTGPANPIDEFNTSVEQAKKLLGTIPSIQSLSQKAESFSEPKRNPFRWDLMEGTAGTAGIATSGMQTASGPVVPAMLPRFLGAFTVGGRIKCLVGLGNRAYLLGSDTEFLGLPFRIASINRSSLAIAFAGGYNMIIDRGPNVFDRVNVAAKVLKERRAWDYPLAGSPLVPNASPTPLLKSRESPR